MGAQYGIKSQYDLLVLGRSEAVYSWIYNGCQPPRRHLSSSYFDEGVTEATPEDVEVATKFLATYVTAAAYLGLTTLRNDLSQKGHETATPKRIGRTRGRDEVGEEPKTAETCWLLDVGEKVSETIGVDFTSVSTDGNSESSGSKSAKSSIGSRSKKSSIESKSDNVRGKIKTIETALDSIAEQGYLCVSKLEPDLGDVKVMKVKLSDYFTHAEHPFVPSLQDHSSNPDQDAFSLSSVDASLAGSFSELSDEEWETESKNDPIEVMLAWKPESPETSPRVAVAVVTPTSDKNGST